ncbi:MAG TPA: SDR family oxidoreductase [Polyangiaceae bacterium]|jgi:peroxisomal 2,4-dienoyl-CoA reductase|nr:SDR family oxidoreductase [Polyangiaceae bacterium]
MAKSAFRSDLFEGKVAFVTGGGSGICFGITRALMEHGASAVILGRKADRLAAAAAELEKTTGKPALAVPCDVRDPKAVDDALKAALERFGKLDVVVNGAAGNFLAPAAALSPNGFKTVLDIDACGTFNVSRAAFDAWLRDHGGVILNISATLHYAATPLQIHASAAKAAIDSMTKTLAVEWGGVGVRVVGIAPGPIDDTEGMSRLAPGDVKQKLIDAIPIKRFGRIDEIASLAVYLCSDAASLIHGETVVADGGAWFAMGPRMM